MSNMASGVYCILNVQNGCRYVGSSKHMAERLEKHFHQLELGTHHNYKLQAAYEACGDVWASIVLERCAPAYLEQAEQTWLNRALRMGRAYNIQTVIDRSLFNDDN